jgi:hypothetical protein
VDKRVIDVNQLETPPSTTDMSPANTIETDAVFDQFSPTLLRAAQSIYSNYCQTHVTNQAPLGIAIDRDTFRGHLIFINKPILLPQECFVPLEELEVLEPALAS